jgi:hypothetical protein
MLRSVRLHCRALPLPKKISRLLRAIEQREQPQLSQGTLELLLKIEEPTPAVTEGLRRFPRAVVEAQGQRLPGSSLTVREVKS